MIDKLLWIVKALKALFFSTGRIFLILKVVAVIAAPLVALFTLYELIGPYIPTLIQKLNAALTNINTAGLTGFAGKVNRIVPISEILLMYSSLLTIRVTAFAVRTIKAFIFGIG